MTPPKQAAEPLLRNYSHIFINATQPGLFDSGQGGQHEVVLQALNRYLLYGEGGNVERVYYGLENFTGTEPFWDKTAVIFQEDGAHPDLAEFADTPVTALKKINARPAGTLCNSKVLSGPGQPRLKSFMRFSDPQVQALYEAGELAISTALFARLENGRLIGKVRPNHVLLFRPGKTQPRDAGSMFLNSVFLHSNDPQGEETITKLDKVLSEFTNSIRELVTGGGGNGGGDGDGGNGGGDGDGGTGGGNGGGDGTGGGNGGGQGLANALEQRNQENTALKSKATALETELKNAQDELKKARQAEADRVWTALKNSQIPPGLVENKEKEEALRQLYNTDRDGFWQKLLAVQKKAPDTNQEGEGFSNSEQLAKLKEVNAAWDQATGAQIKLPRA